MGRISNSKEQIVTGHSKPKKHRFLMNMEDNPCEKCGLEEIDLITGCPGYVGLRIAILGRPREITTLKSAIATSI